MSDNKEFINLTAESPVVLQMLLEEIKQARHAQNDFQVEARTEFRRLHDKIDHLRDEMRDDFQEHDRDIVKLTTEAELAAKRSGFVAGTVASFGVYALIAIMSWALDQIGVVLG